MMDQEIKSEKCKEKTASGTKSNVVLTDTLSNSELVEEKNTLDLAFAKSLRGKYKLEIYFSSGRSVHRAFPGVIKSWVRGGDVCDVSVYFCPTCKVPIMRSSMGDQFEYNGRPCALYYGAICGECGRHYKGEELIDLVGYNTSTEHWVDIIELFYNLLNKDADLYLKYARGTLGKLMQDYQDRPIYRNAAQFALFQVDKDILLLPRDQIIRATIIGQPFRSLIRAFITA